MLKTLILISALTFGSFAAARADGITGNFTLSGTDAYTTTTLNFGSAVIGAAGSGPVTGTFATYLTNGTTVDFYPGTLFYANGSNVVSPAFQLFTVTENGETFTFDLSDYTAVYTSGTNLFGTFTNLTIEGGGDFTGSGSVAYTDSPGSINFSSQTEGGQTTTTFSASAEAAGASPVPEPASLALFGTGLLGVVGIARRKLKV